MFHFLISYHLYARTFQRILFTVQKTCTNIIQVFHHKINSLLHNTDSILYYGAIRNPYNTVTLICYLFIMRDNHYCCIIFFTYFCQKLNYIFTCFLIQITSGFITKNQWWTINQRSRGQKRTESA